jgi:hypothetical protein
MTRRTGASLIESIDRVVLALQMGRPAECRNLHPPGSARSHQAHCALPATLDLCVRVTPAADDVERYSRSHGTAVQVRQVFRTDGLGRSSRSVHIRDRDQKLAELMSQGARHGTKP